MPLCDPLEDLDADEFIVPLDRHRLHHLVTVELTDTLQYNRKYIVLRIE